MCRSANTSRPYLHVKHLHFLPDSFLARDVTSSALNTVLLPLQSISRTDVLPLPAITPVCSESHLKHWHEIQYRGIPSPVYHLFPGRTDGKIDALFNLAHHSNLHPQEKKGRDERDTEQQRRLSTRHTHTSTGLFITTVAWGMGDTICSLTIS